MRLRLAGLVFLLSLIAPEAGSAEDASTPKIWLDLGGIGNPSPSPSWNTLFFDPNAPWPDVMNHVTTVGIMTQVLSRISEDQLAKVVARLKQHHVAISIEMLAQAYTLAGVPSPPGCGQNVEGYFAPEVTAALAAKLKRAGGEPKFISMDEPLWFGHYYNEKNACHSSIENVADRVAANMHEYLKVFPDVVIGDGEPIPAITSQPNWQNDYRQWLDVFRRKVGKPISSTTVDINWGHTNWPDSLRMFASFAHDVHMPIGVIYNAAPPAGTTTNQQWLNDAQKNFTYIENTLHITPEWAVFSSWVRFPGRIISDASGLGEDYLVQQYLKVHVHGHPTRR